jgi:hypothetical protein
LKNGQKLKLGDAHASPQEISKKYKRQSLGMPPRHPLHHRQKSGHLSRHYIFIASYTMCFSWSVSCFSSQFSFALFAAINVWITSCWFGGRHTSLFICQEHSVFHSYRFNECSLFLLPRLAFVFCFDLCSDLALSLHQGVFGPLVHIGFYQKSLFIKSLNGVGKEKKFHAKKRVVQEGACVDCGLGFCMSCLMSF